MTTGVLLKVEVAGHWYTVFESMVPNLMRAGLVVMVCAADGRVLSPLEPARSDGDSAPTD